MANASSMAVNDKLGQTDRKDTWWLEPLLTVIGLGSFGVYTTWAALQNANFEWGPYLSPFYSPYIRLDWMPAWFSPALLILPFPLIFRTTCYYYRKAYYRSFFANPPACSVAGIAPGGYKGETAFPFILQNLHRYAFYTAVVIIGILWYDALKAFIFENGFGIGIGSLIMLANAIFLSLYTFSCHSWRHLIGGRLDKFSCDAVTHMQYKAWDKVSHLNEHHMRWAWISLFTVWGTDLYIRLLASGIVHDWRIL